jgi:hypothetical protein
MSILIPNPLAGTVAYSTGQFDTRKILGENYHTDSAGYGPDSNQTAATNEGTTYRSIDPLQFTLGANQRALVKYHIFWAQNTTGRAKFKVNMSAATEMVRAGVSGIDPANAEIHGIKTTSNFTQNVNVAGSHGYLEIDMIIENDPADNTVDFQFAQYVNNANATTVIRGSYVELLKF